MQDTYSLKVLVIPRKRWLRPDMTEKLLTGTLNLNANNQTTKAEFANTVDPGEKAAHNEPSHLDPQCCLLVLKFSTM